MISDKKTLKITSATRAILCALALMMFWTATTAWCAEVSTTLTDADCGKCHKQPTKQIATLGGAHKTTVGCLGCHENHPPNGEAIIPECSQCHAADESPHFALSSCDRCHSPHAPVIKKFSSLGDLKPVCLTCHQDIGTAMTAAPSLHADQDCAECHQSHGLAKGQFMTCLECHDGHNESMVYQDCLSCHDPHQPTAYNWSPETKTALCGACHANEVDLLAKQGSAHKTDISCSDCHQKHPPATTQVIPACADCHAADDNPHFAVKDCSKCHNPHAPLNIDLSSASPTKPVCLTCHTAPVKQMKKYPSAHADMDCTECHEQHGEHSECLSCHSGHSDTMTYADCLRCHLPHQPTHLQFGSAGVKSQLCGSCHTGQLKKITNNSSQHAKLQCVYCHKRTHKVILTCDNCHGQPHDSSIHQQFKKCAKCHKGPHNLRN